MMRSLLLPLPPGPSRVARPAVLGLLAFSAATLAAGTWAMPAGYSWLQHSVSEAAGQGVRHAWVTRLGFLSFGLAVLVLALCRRRLWARAASWMHLAFALFMLGTAAFSHRPWDLSAPWDPTEDLLHSVTATGMGFAFALGVLARRFQRRAGDDGWHRGLDGVALVAATAMPLVAGAVPEYGGLVQRAMFALAYLWYGVEVLGEGPEEVT